MSRRFFTFVLLAGFTLCLGLPVSAGSTAVTLETRPSTHNQNSVDSYPVKTIPEQEWRRLAVSRGDSGLELPVRPEGAARITMSRKNSESGTAVQLRLRSQPSEARVRLNGQDRGRTPWMGRVRTDTQVVQLKKDGYQSWQMELVPTGDLSLVGILEPETDAETRVIQSSTDGVRTVTDRSASDRPEVFRRVIPPPEGPSKPVQSAVETKEPDTSAKEPQEELLEGSIPLEIESSPPGALVAVDGRELGRTPLLREKFREGTVTVTLKKSGYQVWEERIDLSQPTRLKIKLRKK